jgi:hypothetical protein
LLRAASVELALLDKLMENRVKLDDLENRSADLKSSSIQFESGATKLKNKYKWEKYRIMIALGGCGVVDICHSD